MYMFETLYWNTLWQSYNNKVQLLALQFDKDLFSYIDCSVSVINDRGLILLY